MYTTTHEVRAIHHRSAPIPRDARPAPHAGGDVIRALSHAIPLSIGLWAVILLLGALLF